MKPSRHILYVLLALAAALMGACSSTKHVPDGQYLLESVKITSDNDSVSTTELYNFLRQLPNHKVLGFLKLQLATYNLSGQDSTKWYNRWLRNIGRPPVIYDQELTDLSQLQLRQALVNKGYMDVQVEVDTIVVTDKKKIGVNYNIRTGRPHTIASIKYDIPDTAVASILLSDPTILDIKPGALFDRNELDNVRTRATQSLRNAGYYAFNKDYITFTADTVRGSKDIALTLNVLPPAQSDAQIHTGATLPDTLRHEAYRIRDVLFVTNYDPQASGGTYDFHSSDTTHYKDITVLYGDDRYIRPQVLEEKNFIRPGRPYNARAVERTYEALSQLGILKFINIEMRPAGNIDGTQWLDAYVLLTRNKKQGVSIEVEGTNSEGDLGFGIGATYQHRDVGNSSNMLSAKLRMAYESLSGNFQGLLNNRYTEYAGEVGFTFPRFEFPFFSGRYRKRLLATTELTVSMNYQERPEYTRIIAGAAWKYKWQQRRRSLDGFERRHTFDLLDVSLIRLPKSTINFLDSIAPTNPLLRRSYEDHLIMAMRYTYYMTNKRIPTTTVNAFAIQPSVTTLRLSIESAGNVLYAFSKMFDKTRHDGAYEVFGVQYSQYVKGEATYTYTKNFNSRTALATRVGIGIAVPYLNSRMVPFEERFYAGGANSVRGWGARTLGPGAYDSKNNVTDFINQCGDILLNLGVEYRAKLFWVFEGALFVDAGNIWTIRDYENQPGGVFRFSEFYKQIAASYGLGLRLDFTYFLLRFDLGFKAHNPARNQEPWPIFHPNWHRDATFHFSVGYPF